MKFQFHFAHDILEARTKVLKLTQTQVADAVRVCLRKYQKIEKGTVCPGTEIFLRLVFFFNLDIETYRQDILKPTKDSSD